MRRFGVFAHRDAREIGPKKDAKGVWLLTDGIRTAFTAG